MVTHTVQTGSVTDPSLVLGQLGKESVGPVELPIRVEGLRVGVRQEGSLIVALIPDESVKTHHCHIGP